MASITIDIPDNQLQKLQEIASFHGISFEALLSASIEEWLSGQKSDFINAANYVLKKMLNYTDVCCDVLFSLVKILHSQIFGQSGGKLGMCDLLSLKFLIAQPRMQFGREGLSLTSLIT
ncbi:hypothetical protein Nos7524_4722 [Nostoc sp. PCC 7524]|uniref:hypothetical protein n=1 Tax=Nostoc sp. (strain ATCC 29411 / PCC 7524) TaxID=28072 RepID=UPI00029EFCA8|nr:hypothetical protein [Nostoc sp. PCC 7524]AFY50465.1 hypothetical protein Nos7524_4722 [Nostoc sp. PCC 7524]